MRYLASAFLLAACGGAGASSAWSPKAAAELKAMTNELFVQVDSGQTEVLKASYDENAVVFDTDADNKPIAAYGLAEAKSYIDTLAAAIKQGLKIKTTVNRVDCQATEVFGFCTVEFDQSFTMGGQAMGPFKLRATEIGRKVNGVWKWAHGHGSFREVPAPPPAAPKS